MSDNLPKIREELVALAQEDERVRERLSAMGLLFGGGGYNTIMEAVHQHNAARLRMIIDEHGWPGEKLFGRDGAEAPAWQTAFLEDRRSDVRG